MRKGPQAGCVPSLPPPLWSCAVMVLRVQGETAASFGMMDFHGLHCWMGSEQLRPCKFKVYPLSSSIG